jgi:hypothetical protein
MTQYRKPVPKTPTQVQHENIHAYDEKYGKQPLPTDNRAYEVSTKGDSTKDFSVGLMDIDKAVIDYINNSIQPTVIQDGERTAVPAIYAYPERWVAIQRDGFLRDQNQRILTPLIVLKRDTIDRNRSLGWKLDGNYAQNVHTFEVPYSKKNTYDNFDVLTNRIPVREMRTVVVPDYVTLNYSCVIYTNYVEQINKVIEAIQYASNAYWGDQNRFKFRAVVDSFSTVTEYSTDSDRVTRANFNITLNGYIIPDSVNKNLSTNLKYFTKAQIVIEDYVVDNLGQVSTPAKRKKVIQNQLIPCPPGGENIDPTVLNYLNTNITKVGTVSSTDTYYVTGVILAAPSPLSATSPDNFLVTVNSTIVPRTSVISITQSGPTQVDVVLDIDPNSSTYIGYELQTGDLVTLTGKFAS